MANASEYQKNTTHNPHNPQTPPHTPNTQHNAPHAPRAEDDAVLLQKKHLLERIIYGWPRRGRSLLDVGCGSGALTEIFWQGGFDVTALDASEDALSLARARLASHCDLYLGNAAALPFDDNSFEYVALMDCLEYVGAPEDVLAEALRVAASGVIIGFANTMSAQTLCGKMQSLWQKKARGADAAEYARTALAPKRRYSAFSLCRLVRSVCKKHGFAPALTLQSVLPLPACLGSWAARLGFGAAHSAQQSATPCASFVSYLPLGAYTALRIDCHSIQTSPHTPLLAKPPKAAATAGASFRVDTNTTYYKK